MSDTVLTRALAVGLLVAGCAATDLAFQDSQGRPLDQLGPAPYRIAIAPLDLAGGPLEVPSVGEGDDDEDVLHFSFSRDEVQHELLAALAGLNAASSLVAVGEADIDGARTHRADLLIRPKVRRPATLEHVGRSDHWISGGLLWITTWLGSFWVDDSTYFAQMEVDFEIINPHDGLPVDSITATSDTTDLDYWDRNPFMSWGTAQSLVIPPFWTSDDVETTSRSLSEIACDRLAARLTRYLKEDLLTTEEDYLGQLRLESPENGTDVGGRVLVKGKLITREPVTELFIYLDESDEPSLAMTGESIPPASEQRRGNVYQLLFDQVIDLPPGRHFIALEFGIAGRLTSRTLVVRNGPEETP